MLLFEKIFLVWKILCKCQKNKTKKNQRYQKLNIFPYQSKRAVFGKNFVRCDDRLKHKHELKHLLKTLDSKNVSRKNYTHTGECSCVSRIQGGGGVGGGRLIHWFGGDRAGGGGWPCISPASSLPPTPWLLVHTGFLVPLQRSQVNQASH